MTDYLRDRLVAAVGEHYLVEAELGRGGMAAVFSALDVRLNRRVAIKLLPPELAFNLNVRSRFLREAQMAAGLTHPHIVPIYNVDERDGLVYFVMALVEGQSVALRLGREGAFPIDEARTIIADVADALDYAHRQGVVHRDIKPDNILLDRATGRPRVTDFGIARAAAEEQRLTVTGMAVGTPAYMSPEQAMGEREVDGRSDIYSLGIVAYQMLAGETPFRAINTPAMLMKHVSEPPPPLRARRAEIPPALAAAIERALAKRPEERWRTAGEMREAILDRSAAAPRAYVPQQHALEPIRPSRQFPPGYPEPALREPVLRESAVRDLRPVQRSPITLTEPPAGLSRRERKEWYREQRRLLRDAVHHKADDPPRENRIAGKISRFRRVAMGFLGTAMMLFVINAMSGGEPWFLFPVMGFIVVLMFQLGSLWADGVTVKQIFSGPVRRHENHDGRLLTEPRPPTDPASDLVTKEILDGAHGLAIRRAASSRVIVMDMLRRMTPKEREMLPADLESTVKALVERVASVAMTLHRLDADANGSSLGSLDTRIEGLKREPQSAEQERRLALLERQRATLRDLLERRAALFAQLESASLALENLKLDLVRFRSAGVSSALEDVTSATREARAVSRDIGHLLDAQDELRRL